MGCWLLGVVTEEVLALGQLGPPGSRERREPRVGGLRAGPWCPGEEGLQGLAALAGEQPGEGTGGHPDLHCANDWMGCPGEHLVALMQRAANPGQLFPGPRQKIAGRVRLSRPGWGPQRDRRRGKAPG